MSSGLGSAGASIGHHASVNDVRESAFEAAQRLVPTLASGEFATEVAVAFGARHARLGERRDVERPGQLAVSTASRPAGSTARAVCEDLWGSTAIKIMKLSLS